MVTDDKDLQAFGFGLLGRPLHFLSLLQPYIFSLGLGFFLLLITNVIMVSLPIFINGGVSMIESQNPFIIDLLLIKVSLNHIYTLLGLVILLALTGAVIRTISRKVLFDVGRSVESDVRRKLFFHLSILDDRFFLEHSVGDLMNHLTTDMTNIRMVMGFAALNIMNIIFVFCFTLPMLIKIDSVLTMCALLPFPLVVIATRSITKRLFVATKGYQEQLSRMVDHIQENLLGAHVVRLFHQQDSEALRFKKTNQETYDAGIRLARIRVLMMPMMKLMIGMAVGLVLYAGGRYVAMGRISLGDFVEVNTRILQMAWPAMSVGFVMSIYSRGQASLSRVNFLLSYIPSIKDGTQNVSSIDRIDIHHLVLKKDQADKKHGIGFSVRTGELLGVVGPSGSFKTSLLRAIYRRDMVPFGTIFFNGFDINDLSLVSIYDHIAVVAQESFLFHKTIRENICFARPDASPEEIDNALNIACLNDDIKEFKDGLETIVGERGMTLSGGQRQRIALARAVLAKKSLLILDDALSSVDVHTERHIVRNLQGSLSNSMVIIATHRLLAIKKADNIIVMQKGAVLESGDHEWLMRNGRFYQQLWGLDRLTGRKA